MKLTFKKWDNFQEELVINCFSYFAGIDGIYYRECRYCELDKVDYKEYALWNVER